METLHKRLNLVPFGSYTYLHQTYVAHPIQDAQTAATVRSNIGQDPNNRFHVGVSLDPLENVEFDTNLYFTGPFRQGKVNGYHKLDMRVAWKPVKGFEVSLVGQDMLQSSADSKYKCNSD